MIVGIGLDVVEFRGGRPQREVLGEGEVVVVERAAAVGADERDRATLEANNPGLKVSYTLPVLPTGLTREGSQYVGTAVKDGKTVTIHIDATSGVVTTQ